MVSDSTPLFVRKIRREILVGLSKLGIKRTSMKYRGFKVKVPLIYGIGRYHIVPPDNLWMRKVIGVATRIWPDKAVVDIGANVGQFMLELKAISASTPYYGFEPNPPCIFYLYELIRINRFAKTFVYPVAVSTTDQVSYLSSSAWDSGTSTLAEEYRQGNKEYSTSVYSINGDGFLGKIKDEICLIKIDVEGFEHEVLKGIKDVVNEHRPLIFCEILVNHKDSDKRANVKRNIKSVHELMTDSNYKTCGVGKDIWPFLIDNIEDYMEFGDDFCFIPKEHVEQVMSELTNRD